MNDTDALKTCPRCRSSIAFAAEVCPICHSDIRPKTLREKRWEKIHAAAKFVRDWIGVPLAVITALAALYIPAENTVLRLLGRDGASISFEILKPEIVNIGLDDRSVGDQVDVVTQYINAIRGVLSNVGRSDSRVSPQFRCLVGDDIKSSQIANFDLFDISSQKKIFEEIKVDLTGPAYFYARESSRPEYDNYRSEVNLNSCEFIYYDKNGTHVVKQALSKRESNTIKAVMIDYPDNRITWANRYCTGMFKNFRLFEDVTIDCLNDTHAMAIEPIYLWQRASSRALKFAHGFAKFAANRKPGIILVCDPGVADCKDEAVAINTALATFLPPITTWLCNENENVNLATCRRVDYPLSSP